MPTLALLLGIPVLLILTIPALRTDPERFGRAGQGLASFIGRLFTTPDWDYLPKLLGLVGESFMIAFVATVGAVLFTFPMALLAARNCTPYPVVGGAVRAVASVARAIPDLVLALLMASALGLGTVPGVVALLVASFGFLAKAYSEALEVVDRKPIEGVTAAGADGFSIRWVGVVPQALPDLVGYSLYYLDVNLRSAAILGAVGAGGIGYDLTQAMRLFQFDRLGLILLSIYLSVTFVDLLSAWIRRRLA